MYRTTLLLSQIAFVLIILSATDLYGQKYVTKTGHISFFSHTPLEDIEAHNHQVNSALDASSGMFVFKVLIRSFEFEKALMQEHFNENYLESDVFPTATFKGKIEGHEIIDFGNLEKRNVTVTGKLNIHGVERDVTHEGTLENVNGKIMANSKFMVKPADYDIKIAKAVVDNIAKEIEVTVQIELQELKK